MSSAALVMTQDYIQEKMPRQALGLFSGISNKAYHNSPGISSSQLKDYIHAPKIHRAYQTGELVFKTTPAMELGTTVHTLVLEPENFDKEFAIRQKVDGRTNAGKAYKVEFEADNAGKLIIDAEEFDTAQRIRDAILNHPEVRLIFAEGEAESSGYYLDENDERETGTFQLCRYRPDWRREDGLFDVKTCRDASPVGFMHQINNLGYHISAAHYIEGDRILKNTDHRQFTFIAAETEPPYLVAVYILSERSLQLGEHLRRIGLNGLKASRENDFWPSYNHDLATEINLPNYLFYDMDRGQI